MDETTEPRVLYPSRQGNRDRWLWTRADGGWRGFKDLFGGGDSWSKIEENKVTACVGFWSIGNKPGLEFFSERTPFPCSIFLLVSTRKMEKRGGVEGVKGEVASIHPQSLVLVRQAVPSCTTYSVGRYSM